MNRKRKKKISLDQSEGFGQSLGQSFAETLGLSMPSEAQSAPPKSEPDLAPTSSSSGLLVEMIVSKKGRGGKTVTECLGLSTLGSVERKTLAKTVSSQLGTRVFWAEERLCVQGDLRQRLTALFETAGHQVKS